ncbi:MAG: hypothetical protein LBF24_01820 [Puniceicoccales bacterium]|jgi:hypothetical protein|nr:hypothetical protein [Puniceicoccales bacterium]
MIRSALLPYFLAGTVFLSGCRSVGPTALQQSHSDFNCAIAHSNDEQLLLNLVRMRYLETTLFLEVGTITDSRSRSCRVGVDGMKLFVDPSERIMELTPTAGASISQMPTVVYSPMQGQTFVKRLFSPMPLPVLLSLIQSGWSASRVFGIFVESVNNLQNAPTASGPTPARVPVYQDFYRMAQLFTRLLWDGSLTMGMSAGDPRQVVLCFFDYGSNRQDICELKELLDLPQDQDRFVFRENFFYVAEGELELRLRARSVQGAMFYLANGVRIPPEHCDAGVVAVTRYPSGSAFDWSDLLGQLFTVHCSKERPENAFVSVRHRDYWFYVEDSDITSKATFMLLANAFSLQAGDAGIIAPTLAISTAR